jgi:hypothetical protein
MSSRNQKLGHNDQSDTNRKLSHPSSAARYLVNAILFKATDAETIGISLCLINSCKYVTIHGLWDCGYLCLKPCHICCGLRMIAFDYPTQSGLISPISRVRSHLFSDLTCRRS